MQFKKRKGLTLINDLNTITFRLYNTNILTFKDNTMTLNTDGWKTNHSKNCINDNLPQGFKVYQKDHVWYLETPNKTLTFFDNMSIELTA
jgi:hypothetical protein